MEHFSNSIDGWCDFQDIYSEMVNLFPNESHFVEVGAAWGKSTSYMAVEIINSNKNIKFDVIDNWKNDSTLLFDLASFNKFKKNIESVQKYINPIIGDSNILVNLYENSSLDFVFLDASHQYEDVKKDIELWYPKIKQTGIIAGHDFVSMWPGVIWAVSEYFGSDYPLTYSLSSWLVKKNEFEKFKNEKSSN